MNEGFYLRVAERIRSRREELRLTQADLADRAGVTRSSVANIETGRQAVLLHQFVGLARALDMPWDQLMPKEGDHVPEEGSRPLPKGVQAFVASVASPVHRGKPKQ